jgi:hypothetical protein
MKRSMTLLGALAISCSAFASTYDADTTSLISVSQFSLYCPAEFAAATDGKAILSVRTVDDETMKYATTMVMITGYPAASLSSPKTLVNRVTLLSKPSESGGAPAHGPQFEHVCKIESVEPSNVLPRAQ